MRSSRTRWAAASVLVALGWFVTPQPVPVYDGVGAPDEPYRYVSAPAGVKSTPAPTSAAASTPVSAGASTNGLSLTSAETGPQVALFLPAAALGAPSRSRSGRLPLRNSRPTGRLTATCTRSPPPILPALSP